MKTSNARSSANGATSNSNSANLKRRGSEPAGNSTSAKNDASNNSASNGTPNATVTNGNGHHINGTEPGTGHQNGSTDPVVISNKIRAETIQADREAFLSAFEKPTQIYRYMRTRMLHSPVYLPRTLSYMKERMSRNHAGRKAFKVENLLGIVEAKLEVEQKERRLNGGLGKLSNQQNFYNIIFLGFSDPTHNWNTDAKAKVEMKIARICVKKRKETTAPIKKAFEGGCEIKLLQPNTESTETKPNVGSNQHISRNSTKCPVLSIPSDCINLVNGHVVRSYVMMVKVSLYLSSLAKPFSNGSITKAEGSPESSRSLVPSSPQLSRKLASVSIKRLSLSNNSTLNSHNNCSGSTGSTSSSSNSSRASSETDFDRMNPKVAVVKQEAADVGSEDEDLDKQPKLKRRRSIPAARDTEQFIYPGVGGFSNTLGCRDTSDDQISFMGEVTIYDKQLNMQLMNADYDLLLRQSQKKRPQLTFSKLMKQEAAWEILDSSHPKVQGFPDGNANDKPKLKLALRISPIKLGPFVDPPVPLSSVAGKQKGNSNNKTEDEETEHETTKVIYQFLYNNNSRQQTEARDDLRCPWCSLNCFKLYSLLKHLKLCHTRFHFAYVPVPNGARIDVSINESFDGSYTGSAFDLVTQPPGEAFARNGPTKRTNVFSMLVFKPPKLKQTLQEFLESEENDADQRRAYMTGHNRLYYHTTTCLPIHPKEIDVDSEGEPDPEWLQLKTSSMIDEFTDVNEGEKEVMKMWNLHVLKHNYVGDCQIPLACEMFVECQGKELIRRNLYRNFILHLTSMFDFGLLTPEGMCSVVKKLQAQMKDNNTAGSLRESWKALNNSASGPNFSQFKFEPPTTSSR